MKAERQPVVLVKPGSWSPSPPRTSPSCPICVLVVAVSSLHDETACQPVQTQTLSISGGMTTRVALQNLLLCVIVVLIVLCLDLCCFSEAQDHGNQNREQTCRPEVSESSEILGFPATLNLQTSLGEHGFIWSDQSTRASRSDSHDRCAALLSHFRQRKRD